jgi:hypothetical protein
MPFGLGSHGSSGVGAIGSNSLVSTNDGAEGEFCTFRSQLPQDVCGVREEALHFMNSPSETRLRDPDCSRTEEKRMSDRIYGVNAEWDDEASVWVATSSDVPGLVTEAGTLDGLIEKLRVMVPEMLELNGVLPAAQAGAARFRVTAERIQQARAVA